MLGRGSSEHPSRGNGDGRQRADSFHLQFLGADRGGCSDWLSLPPPRGVALAHTLTVGEEGGHEGKGGRNGNNEPVQWSAPKPPQAGPVKLAETCSTLT